jgi:hypothetical protein
MIPEGLCLRSSRRFQRAASLGPMHTKAAPSIALLRGRRPLPLLEAYFELHHLKHL